MTRDRRYRLADHDGRAFVVVDTGGMTEAHTEIERELMRQTEQAIAEADVLVLVVDAQEGCVASDQEFHARLRTCGKPLLVAVNKVDGRDPHAAVAEFAELGASALFGISAKRGSGVTALLDFAIPVEAGIDGFGYRSEPNPGLSNRATQRRQVHSDQSPAAKRPTGRIARTRHDPGQH